MPIFIPIPLIGPRKKREMPEKGQQRFESQSSQTRPVTELGELGRGGCKEGAAFSLCFVMIIEKDFPTC